MPISTFKSPRPNLRSLARRLLMAYAMVGGLAFAEFSAPVNFTANDQPAAHEQMSRSTSHVLEWGPDGNLHLVYWDGGNTTRPDLPSTVWHRAWSPATGWRPRAQLDQSLTPTGQKLGGRHPALAFLSDDSLFVTWHDHRDCTQTLGWVNNVEIYGDRALLNGPFSSTDLRLTASASGTAGDNSYLPKVVGLPGNRLALAWYDYYWDVDGPSDLSLRVVDASAPITPGTQMNDYRLTGPGDRDALDANEDFSVPDVVAGTSGTLHLCWQSGSTAMLTGQYDLYYGHYDPDSKSWLQKLRVRSDAGHFLDPAKILVDAEGVVYLLYADYSGGATRRLMLQKKEPLASTFAAPVTLASFTITNPQPRLVTTGLAAALATRGTLEIALVQFNANSRRELRLLEFDPDAGSAISSQILTAGLSGNWNRPAVAIDDEGFIHVVWEEEVSSFEGDLWFTTNYRKNASRWWANYE